MQGRMLVGGLSNGAFVVAFNGATSLLGVHCINKLLGGVLAFTRSSSLVLAGFGSFSVDFTG